jgi:spore maturation protein CgeB
MGSNFNPTWVQGLKNIHYHNLMDDYGNQTKLYTWEERRDIHLRSKIAFGFQNPPNIINFHVTQRIFEAMAYGCVVLSESYAATELTGGIVVHTPTRDEFVKQFNYYLDHPQERIKKARDGYEWVKKYGTNRYAAQLFLDKFEELGFV